MRNSAGNILLTSFAHAKVALIDEVILTAGSQLVRRLRPKEPALAAERNPLFRLGFGNHAAANSGGHRHPLL